MFGITWFINGDTRTFGTTNFQFHVEQIPEVRTVVCAEYRLTGAGEYSAAIKSKEWFQIYQNSWGAS